MLCSPVFHFCPWRMIKWGITWISGVYLVNSVTAHLLELLLYTSPPAYDLRTWSVLLNALMVALFSLRWKTHPLDLDQEMNLAFWPTRKTVKFCFTSEEIRTSLQANLTALLGKTGDAFSVLLYFAGDSDRAGSMESAEIFTAQQWSDLVQVSSRNFISGIET